MCQIIKFPVNPRKTHAFIAHLVRDVCELPDLNQSYVCPRCAAQLTTRKLWVDALINCRCGAEMRPVEAK